MDYIGDEDDLFDNDLEDVPANTLEQIERRAVTLSQRPLNGNNFPRAAATRDGGYDTYAAATRSHTISNGDDDVDPPPSSDYGFDDEDVVDLDDPTVTFGQHDAPFPIGTKPAGQSGFPRFQENADDSGGEIPVQGYQVSADLENFQARIAELEHDQIRLSKELDEARIDVTTKSGAIANLRSRHERTTKEFEAKLAALRQEQLEERARLQVEIQAAKNDREKIKVSNKFLEHDLAEERNQAAKRSRAAKEASARPGAGSNTPKKLNKPGFADGFDDHEIIAASPTKRRPTDRQATPKAGNKRKRDAIPSPAASVQDASLMVMNESTIAGPRDDDLDLEAATLSRLIIRDERLETIQMVLKHQLPDERRTLEVLSVHQFPGDQNSIASHLLDALSAIPPEDSLPASVAVRGICLDLWERCLREQHWTPLWIILTLFSAMLEQEPSKTQVHLFERLVVLACKSYARVAEPRFKLNATSATSTANQNAGDDVPAIDDTQVLTLLHAVAIASSFRSEQAGAFWQRIESNFVLLVLHKSQPLPHIRLMLQMISTSVLEDSFGVRVIGADQQTDKESMLLDRLVALLFDKPASSQGGTQYVQEDIADFRLETLRTIRAISGSQHGGSALAQHPRVIGKLICFLYDQTTALYDTTPLPSPFIVTSGDRHVVRIPTKPTLHDKLIAAINITVRILRHLLHDYKILLSEKHTMVRGSEHKFQIGLSRIAFSERLLLEAGLEDEVVEAAHEILDNTLTPEEGEAILLAMDTPRSSRPSASAPR